ncbi:acyl-CoA dehydrogenase [Nocardia colli]|uniref:Acyl-[acyl-carrier-protein] dehydrogenase MbtN n=2 Tax=Nocardia colli TaxID=2545717 RepID=A0A5N0EF71_9NOCA|nr:acyl-CoA dehydrogenase family protein [Nocardia colli]KAA8886884.1 acyl-CoA dehydrogenase [Nocardia colli]
MAKHRSRWMDAEMDALAELSRDFFGKECAPHEERWAEQQHIDREVWLRAGQLGLLCPSVPEEFGGGGGDFRHDAVIAIEQVRALAPSFGGPVHSTIIAHYIAGYGTDEQKKTWLPKLASGEIVAAIAMTEPGTGSDLQAIRTTATVQGDEYVVNGAKTFISNGFLADLVLVVAKTNEQGGAGGLSLIAVETTREGFRRGRNLHKIGQHGQDTCELFFDEVRVPRTNLIGEAENQGFIQLMQQLAQERLIIAVTAMATMEKTVELTLEYTRERTAFGKPLFGFQNTKFTLAECDTAVTVGWSFLDDCVEKHVRGELDIPTAAKAKLWLSEQQNILADRCLQLFGGYGYMAEYPIARIFTDSRIQKIYGGTNEIMKEIIARGL